MYEYKVKEGKVGDEDTVDVDIDLCFGTPNAPFPINLTMKFHANLERALNR